MKQEALKLALDALERSVATCFDQYAHRQVMSQPDHFINQAITAIKEALREHAMREVQRLGQEIEQEPVKYSDYEPDGVHHNKPPQRTWVGLTDLQKQAIKFAHSKMGMMMIDYDLDAMLEATEQALKEKNT